MKNNMKKAALTITGAVLAVLAGIAVYENHAAERIQAENGQTETIEFETMAASENAVIGDEETFDLYPMNFMEERTLKYEYDSFDEIISNLKEGEAYGYAKVMGEQDKVLFITDETFDGYGFPASIKCYPYTKGRDGKYRCDSILTSVSTSTPISVSRDGLIMTASHNDVSFLAYSRETHGIMCVEYVYVNWGKQGFTNTYGGFIRESNSFNAPEKQVELDSSTEFEEAFAEFDSAEPIHFTVVTE